MKKTLIVLALVFILTAPSYAAAQESEVSGFNAQVKTFLNKVFTGNKGGEEAPTIPETETAPVILKTKTAPITSERGEESGTFTKEESGVSVRNMIVMINKSFRISLEANASTGYRWDVDFNEMYLTLLNTNYVIAESTVDQSNIRKEIVGGGGERIYTFKAIKVGTTKLMFSYISPGDEIVTEQKIYVVNVVSDTQKPSDDATQPSIGVESSVTVKSNSDVQPGTNVSPSVKNFGNKIKSFFNRSVFKKNEEAPVESEQLYPRSDNEVNVSEKDLRENRGPGEFRPADESQVPQEVKVKLEEKREEVRQKIQFHQSEMEMVKIEAQKKIQEKRAELNEKLQQIKSEQKRRAAEQIHQNLYNVREKILSSFSRTTDRLETVLTNIATRADKMEAEGINIENVQKAVQDTQLQINSTQEQIKNLFQKEYDIQIADKGTLREDFRITRDELHNDLSGVKNIVKEAYQAARSAAMELTQSK